MWCVRAAGCTTQHMLHHGVTMRSASGSQLVFLTLPCSRACWQVSSPHDIRFNLFRFSYRHVRAVPVPITPSGRFTSGALAVARALALSRACWLLFHIWEHLTSGCPPALRWKTFLLPQAVSPRPGPSSQSLLAYVRRVLPLLFMVVLLSVSPSIVMSVLLGVAQLPHGDDCISMLPSITLPYTLLPTGSNV